jgi:hypothetical protein
MTDCFHVSPDRIGEEAAEVAGLGIPAVLLFGLPAHKDDQGFEAWSESGPMQQAIRAIKKRTPDLLVVTDGDNTSGRSPELVARDIFQKSEQGVAIYFVAFDTNADRFAFLKQVHGDVIGAGNGVELRKALDGIYQGRILAEASMPGEREPESR